MTYSSILFFSFFMGGQVQLEEGGFFLSTFDHFLIENLCILSYLKLYFNEKRNHVTSCFTILYSPDGKWIPVNFIKSIFKKCKISEDLVQEQHF